MGKRTKPQIGKRIFAGLFDYLIIYSFLFIFVYFFGETTAEGEKQVTGLPMLIPIIFWGLMTIGAEQLFGRTLGNYAVDLQPFSIENMNKKLTFGQSFKRHLLDPIDMFFFGLVGILLIKNTENNQRLGDVWAKTIVINTKGQKV